MADESIENIDPLFKADKFVALSDEEKKAARDRLKELLPDSNERTEMAEAKAVRQVLGDPEPATSEPSLEEAKQLRKMDEVRRLGEGVRLALQADEQVAKIDPAVAKAVLIKNK